MTDEPRASIDLIAFISDKSVKYLPRLNPITGSREATIFLLRALEWWQFAKNTGRDSFWKFFGPCKHKDYRPGDSWQEELGFSRTELETALSKVGTRIGANDSKTAIIELGATADIEVARTSAVMYWVRENKTYWQVNEAVVYRIIAEAYSQNLHYIENAGNLHSMSNAGNLHSMSNAGNLHSISYTEKNDQSTSNRGTPTPTGASKSKAKRKSTSTSQKDERRKHPAIGLIRGIIGFWPAKVYWDDIIKFADPEGTGISKLDQRKLKDILQVAHSHGVKATDLLTWFFDWYVKGIPEKHWNRPITGELADKYRRERNGIAYEHSTQGGQSNQAGRSTLKLRTPLNESNE